jgi:hypothetical protein
MNVMPRILLPFFLVAGLLVGQYKVKPGGAPPSELDAAIAGVLQKQGVKLVGESGPIAELWLRTTMPSGPQVSEDSVTMPTVPHGSLLGAVKVSVNWSDRRGLQIKPGVYTLRFSYYPQDGAHQGAAPQRDFVILCLASEDKDLNATPKFEDLMKAASKASGVAHPLSLSVWKEDPKYFKAGSFEKQGEHDWIYQLTIGDVPVTIILAGKAEG